MDLFGGLWRFCFLYHWQRCAIHLSDWASISHHAQAETIACTRSSACIFDHDWSLTYLIWRRHKTRVAVRAGCGCGTVCLHHCCASIHLAGGEEPQGCSKLERLFSANITALLYPEACTETLYSLNYVLQNLYHAAELLSLFCLSSQGQSTS